MLMPKSASKEASADSTFARLRSMSSPDVVCAGVWPGLCVGGTRIGGGAAGQAFGMRDVCGWGKTRGETGTVARLLARLGLDLHKLLLQRRGASTATAAK